MRTIAVAALIIAVAACSRQESATADSPAAATSTPAALTNADLIGTWEAKGMPMDRDTVVVTFTMMNTADSSIVVFPSGETVRNTSGVFAGDSVVSTAGPFKSQVRKGLTVTTRMVMRKQGDQLVGVNQSKYSNGDSATFRITATKKM